MKKYLIPELEIIAISESILTTSGTDEIVKETVTNSYDPNGDLEKEAYDPYADPALPA